MPDACRSQTIQLPPTQSRSHIDIGCQMKLAPIAFVTLLCVVAAAPSFSLSNVFGDHMVLQRDRPSMLFGFANEGVSIIAEATGGVTGTFGYILPTARIIDSGEN